MLVKHLYAPVLSAIPHGYSILSIMWLTARLSLIQTHSLHHSLYHLFTLSHSLDLSHSSIFSLTLTFHLSLSVSFS